MVLSEIFVGMILSVIIGKPVAEYSDSNTFYALGVFSSKLLLFIFIKPIEIHISLSDSKFPKLVVLFQLSIPCASFLIIWSVSNSLYENNNNNNILFLIAIVALIAANIAVLYIFNAYLREYDRRNELLMVNQLINYQAQHFRDLASSNSTTRQTFHDLKNSLFAISSALKENEITSAISIINTLCHEVSNDFNLFATNNSAFNALLAAKYRSMTESEIQFKLKSFMLSHNAIDNFDLCILLGNLLDNAIEACEKIKSNKKEITLHIIQAGDYLTIQVLNTIEKRVQVIENNIETTKEDKNCHGFGLKSIKAIVEKYEGFYSIRQSNDTFSVIISIQNNLNGQYYNQVYN